MEAARRKLVCLWLSHVARVAADSALGCLVALVVFRGPCRHCAWSTAAVLFVAPAVLLAPVIGPLCNGTRKSAVLFGAALLALAGTLFALWLDPDPPLPWLAAVALVMAAAALYGTARDALLPAAADATRWPLSRLNAAFRAGAAVAVAAGIAVALGPAASFWHTAALDVVVLSVLALPLAWPVQFPDDGRRPASAWQAAGGFFRDSGTALTRVGLGGYLVGTAGLRAVLGLAAVLGMRSLGGTDEVIGASDLGGWAGGFLLGAAFGALLAGVQPHPRRVLAMAPLGAAGLAAALGWAAGAGAPSLPLLVALGVAAGLVEVPLSAGLQSDLPPAARGNGLALRGALDHLAVGVAVFAGLALDVPPHVGLALLAAVAGLAALAYAWRFRREVGESLVEVIFFAMYRFGAAGPGLADFPPRGPVLVIANHSAWLDPCWLAKVLPRTVIPMMTNAFFDTTALRWLMVHVVRAIRVDSGKFRRDLRELPELREAIATLDRGECLLIFPEGAMRRGADRPLRMFGQGVWHILRERPATPVVVCWIEGGWGSYFSYQGGPPTRNKRFDWRRPITVALEAARPLEAEVLADQRRTRVELMRACLAARRWLGLEPLTLPEESYSAEGAEPA